MGKEFRIAIIGLDTSHTIEFTRRLQGEAPPGQRVEGLRVVTALRFPSAFQSEEGQDERQRQVEGWGVKVTRSLAAAVSDVDGIMLEINHPGLHLEYFRQVAELGKPVFLDKPLAGSLADGRAIIALAAAKGTRLWSSSSLRFIKPLIAARAAVSQPELGHVYGVLGKAAAGSDLVWYGIHTFEMLAVLMGTGAHSVRAQQDARGVVAVVRYTDGRRGIAECNVGPWYCGGRVQGGKELGTFESRDVGMYDILCRIREFFLDDVIPVPLSETLEIAATIDAAERAIVSGKEESLVPLGTAAAH